MDSSLTKSLLIDNKCLDSTSPYYLHLGENSGMILVSPPFNETNYHTWSRNMKRNLLSKNKLRFIDGNICKPGNNDPIFETWERCNIMVLSWITRTLTPQIVESIVCIYIAKSLWKVLKEILSKGDHFLDLRFASRSSFYQSRRKKCN